MASSKEYLNYILEQLSELEDITYKSMMGEYMIYYRGRIACYICDDRLLANSCSCLYSGMALVYFPFITADTSDGVAILPLSISLGCSAFTIFPSFPL